MIGDAFHVLSIPAEIQVKIFQRRSASWSQTLSKVLGFDQPWDGQAQSLKKLMKTALGIFTALKNKSNDSKYSGDLNKNIYITNFYIITIQMLGNGHVRGV